MMKTEATTAAASADIHSPYNHRVVWEKHPSQVSHGILKQEIKRHHKRPKHDDDHHHP